MIWIAVVGGVALLGFLGIAVAAVAVIAAIVAIINGYVAKIPV